MTTKFKPCPFYGYDNIGVKSVVLDRFMGKNSRYSAIARVWAYCRVCDCEGPKRTGDLVYEDEIIALVAESWNHRKVREDKNE